MMTAALYKLAAGTLLAVLTVGCASTPTRVTSECRTLDPDTLTVMACSDATVPAPTLTLPDAETIARGACGIAALGGMIAALAVLDPFGFVAWGVGTGAQILADGCVP